MHPHTVAWVFCGNFGAVAFDSLSSFSNYVSNIFQLLVNLFPPASSQGPVLFFWDWFAFFVPKYSHLWENECVCFLSGIMALWPPVFTLAYCCVYLKIAPSNELALGRFTIVVPEVLAAFLIWIFPWCQAKRHWVWKFILKNYQMYTCNWLQLAYQKLIG